MKLSVKSSQKCHAERSEASLPQYCETLRSQKTLPQSDMVFLRQVRVNSDSPIQSLFMLQ